LLSAAPNDRPSAEDLEKAMKTDIDPVDHKELTNGISKLLGNFISTVVFYLKSIILVE